MYYTYVLLCTDKSGQKKHYIGYSQDLRNRYKKHILRQVDTTKKFDRIDLIYYEACLNRIDAMHRERQLKTGFGRGYLKRRLANFLKSE